MINKRLLIVSREEGIGEIVVDNREWEFYAFLRTIHELCPSEIGNY